MTHHTTSLAMDAPPEKLWRILTDTSLWPLWGTSIEEVRCTDAQIRQGSKGTIKIAHLPLHLPFEVTTFDEEAMFWSWRVSRVEATSHKIERPPDAPPRVVFGVPSALYLPYLAICKLALKNIEEMATQPMR